ncbi:hypothetical protein FKM82_024885 [Ascaphus truei]
MIVTFKTKKKLLIETDIKTLQTKLQEYTKMEGFLELDTVLAKNMTKLEKEIMIKKQAKCMSGRSLLTTEEVIIPHKLNSSTPLKGGNKRPKSFHNKW